MSRKRVTLITGKLAEPALRKVMSGFASTVEYDLIVMPVQVAALMTTRYIARKLPSDVSNKVVIPGGCKGKISEISKKTGHTVSRGPEDISGLPEYFGNKKKKVVYSKPRLKIIAEIVDVPFLTVQQILKKSKQYQKDGADWVDLGLSNDTPCPHLGETVRELKKLGMNVSVDTFNPKEMLVANRAGARMFLSVNSSNIAIAPKLKGRVVVIPDFGKGITSLYNNLKTLEKMGVDYVVDPILDPLPFGLVDSLTRYVAVRKKYPNASMMMGAGNLTELTAADNVGINAVITGMCTELDVEFMLTTEVVGWNSGSVAQISLARKIMEHSYKEKTLPKGYDDRLLVLKDRIKPSFNSKEIHAMGRKVRDHNYRIFVAEGFIHIFNCTQYIKTKSAEELFDKLNVDDPSHAYYLGKEVQKAQTALQLGKNYIQEHQLDWGYLSHKRQGS